MSFWETLAMFFGPVVVIGAVVMYIILKDDWEG